jgi:hypothetical protein
LIKSSKYENKSKGSQTKNKTLHGIELWCKEIKRDEMQKFLIG